MKSQGSPWTLRGKVAAWSTAVMLGALVLYSGIVYVSLRQVLWHELDERLHNDIETLEGLLQPFWAADGLQLPHGQSALDKGQQLSVTCAAGSAYVDPTVLRIAVANVLHNAIRYSPPSSEVGLRAFGTDASWIIEVEDHGPGIPQAHHPHLFERFYRVDPGRSRALGGVGLGLAMARWSVEAHGGRIEVDSDAGAGSRFRLVLPRGSGRPTEAVNLKV